MKILHHLLMMEMMLAVFQVTCLFISAQEHKDYIQYLLLKGWIVKSKSPYSAAVGWFTAPVCRLPPP